MKTAKKIGFGIRLNFLALNPFPPLYLLPIFFFSFVFDSASGNFTDGGGPVLSALRLNEEILGTHLASEVKNDV